MNVSDVVKILEDPKLFTPILARLGQEAAAEVLASGVFKEAPQIVEMAFEVLATKHSSLVFEHTASPIERIWVNSLQMQFMRNASMLMLTPPRPDFPKFREAFPITLNYVDEFLRTYTGSLACVDEHLHAEIKAGRLEADKFAATYEPIMEYGVFPYREAFHLTLQAGFPKCASHSKAIRVDALIWHPSVPSLQVAVELDGYEFHSSRDSFTSDRQRDRRLNALGVQVFRFSGSEIHRDPVAAVVGLYDHIWDAKNRASPPEPAEPLN